MNEHTRTVATDEERDALIRALEERNIGFCEIILTIGSWIVFSFRDREWCEFVTPFCRFKEDTAHEFATKLHYYTPTVLARRMGLFASVFEKWAAK